MKGDGQLYLVSSPLSSLQHPCTVVFHIKERDWLAQQLITDLRLSRPPVGTLDLTHTQKKMLPKKYILPPFGKKNEITDFWTRWIIGFMCRQSPNNGGQVGTELMILLSCLLFKWFYYLDIIKWELGRSISQFCCHRAYINRDRDLQIMIFNLCRARTVCYFLLMAGAVRVVRVKCKHLVMETFHSHARISTVRVCR